MNRVIRIIRDLMFIIFILIMPMWLMELLKMDVSLQNIIAELESEDKDADKKCTYKETGCGSCKRQLDCPIEANKAERSEEE